MGPLLKQQNTLINALIVAWGSLKPNSGWLETKTKRLGVVGKDDQKKSVTGMEINLYKI